MGGFCLFILDLGLDNEGITYMKKILFLIHDLGQGGAEKVLVNLVNNMNHNQFDITIIALFAGGVNEQFLSKNVKYKTIFKKIFPGNSKIMKLLSPEQLHRWFIKETYDIEISYLEGPSARIISGCQNLHTKLVSWIHVEQHTINKLSMSFRNTKEAIRCYNNFDQIVCVSEYVKKDFKAILNYQKTCRVLYNTVESDKIKSLSNEEVNIVFNKDYINLIAVGTLKYSKGYDRILKIIYNLKINGYRIHLYILGIGPLKAELEKIVKNYGIEDNVRFLGYDTNPYKYVSKCDLFICASRSEGFSTAATESLIVGTPVCTVEVSGMKEMLGENNEYGIVTKNNTEDLYKGIEAFLKNENMLRKYKIRALERSKMFSTKKTVFEVEKMLKEL